MDINRCKKILWLAGRVQMYMSLRSSNPWFSEVLERVFNFHHVSTKLGHRALTKMTGVDLKTMKNKHRRDTLLFNISWDHFCLKIKSTSVFFKEIFKFTFPLKSNSSPQRNLGKVPAIWRFFLKTAWLCHFCKHKRMAVVALARARVVPIQPFQRVETTASSAWETQREPFTSTPKTRWIYLNWAFIIQFKRWSQRWIKFQTSLDCASREQGLLKSFRCKDSTTSFFT